MGLRIGTNSAALSAVKYIRQTQNDTQRAMSQLSSGSRFSSSGEDPAGFSISERLRGQAQGLRASKMNADNAISFVQVAEGGLQEQNNILIRLRELGIQSASDTVSDTERSFINKEFQQLLSETDRIANTTQFGSNKLLVGSGKSYTFQVGAYDGPENQIKYTLNSNTSNDALGINKLSVSDREDALDTISQIDQALSTLGEARASFGAIQSRLEHTVSHLSSHEFSIEEARSKIADTDIAKSVSDLSMNQIKNQFQIAVLSQAHTNAQGALKLLQF